MFIKSLACNGLSRFWGYEPEQPIYAPSGNLADRPDISGGRLVSGVQRRRMRLLAPTRPCTTAVVPLIPAGTVTTELQLFLERILLRQHRLPGIVKRL